MSEPKQKVHIVFDRKAIQAEGALDGLLKSIARVANLDPEACEEIKRRNASRLSRFAMLSADLPASSIERVREIPGIEAVELDSIKRAI